VSAATAPPGGGRPGAGGDDDHMKNREQGEDDRPERDGAAAPRAILAVRWTLRGRVQGVGFRYFTRGVARELGLAGRVRNLHTGHVEIEAAGEPELVEELRRLVRRGPPGALVIEVREEILPAGTGWDSFEIDH
jgi:acylphosphatase